MANAASAKGNPASKRMSNPAPKMIRAKNKTKNEQAAKKGLKMELPKNFAPPKTERGLQNALDQMNRKNFQAKA